MSIVSIGDKREIGEEKYLWKYWLKIFLDGKYKPTDPKSSINPKEDEAKEYYISIIKLLKPIL